MEPEWIAVIASGVAAAASLAAHHAARINATVLAEITRSLGARLTDSVDTAGREQRAIGKLEGGKDERLDQAARLEQVRANSVLVTELPSEERRADEAE